MKGFVIMKRFVLLLSIVLCVALCAGCNTKTANVSQKGSLPDNKTGEINCAGDTYFPTFEKLKEYNNFVEEASKNGQLPEDFVSYDKIKGFGKFNLCVFLGSPASVPYTGYMYSISGAENKKLSLYVYNEKTDNTMSWIEKITDGVVSSDMRTIADSSGTKQYVYNNISYIFALGKLASICWVSNGIYFSLSDTQSNFEILSSYPLASDTLESKLLNLNTAVQAITEHFGTPQPIEDFFNQG